MEHQQDSKKIPVRSADDFFSSDDPKSAAPYVKSYFTKEKVLNLNRGIKNTNTSDAINSNETIGSPQKGFPSAYGDWLKMTGNGGGGAITSIRYKTAGAAAPSSTTPSSTTSLAQKSKNDNLPLEEFLPKGVNYTTTSYYNPNVKESDDDASYWDLIFSTKKHEKQRAKRKLINSIKSFNQNYPYISPGFWIDKATNLGPIGAPLSLGLAIGGLAAGGTYLGTKAYKAYKGEEEDPEENKQNAISGGILGGLIAAAAGYMTVRDKEKKQQIMNAGNENKKSASFNKKAYPMFGAPFQQLPHHGFSPDYTNVITNKLMGDMSLSYSDKQELSRMIQSLTESQKSQLSKVIAPMVGGGIGFVVAKFLLGLGFKSQILFSIAGAMIGNVMQHGLHYNHMSTPVVW